MQRPIFTHGRVVSVAASVAVAASLVLGPGLAQAASLTTGQIDAVLNLLTAFGVSTSTIATVQSTLEGATVSTSTPAVQQNGCATISGNLGEGDDNGDVSNLQRFLDRHSTVYPNGLITGYFGSLTEKAIEHFQEDHGIVATGTPETTGFGFLGPRTREEISREMEQDCQGENAQGGEQDHAASTSPEHQSESATASSTQDHNSGD